MEAIASSRGAYKMTIPQIDQDLATVKAMHIQHENGYHISLSDWKALVEAIARINNLMGEIAREAK